MGTFDAGTIEAKLVLDRSQFDRELAQAQAQVARFEANDAEKNVDIEVDSSGASAEIAKVDAELAALPSKKEVKIDVDSGNGVSRTQALVSAIIAGLPLIPPVAAAAAAGIVALSASLVAAAGGAAVLGLGIFGAIQKFQQAKKDGDAMTGSMKVFATALSGMQKAFASFTTATQAASFGLMAQGLNIIAGILPRLVPIFNSFAAVASNALTGLGNWFNGPEGQGMLRWFQTFGAQQFGVILQILGNLGRTILNLLQAFSPLATIMMNGLQQMTAGWVTWSSTISSNRGFQDFIAYVQQVGPMVIAAITSLGAALINIGVALAPLGPPLLQLITNFGNLISAMNPTVLRAILVVIGGLVLAWTAFEAVMSVVNAATAMWSGLMAVVRFATLAWTAAQWLLNVALTANPIGIVIVAIAALVAVLILAWQHSETFRNVVIAVWNTIRTTVMAITSQIVSFVTAQWRALVSIVTGVVQLLTAIIQVGFTTIAAVVRVAIAAVTAAIRIGALAWGTAIRLAANLIRITITTAFNVIRAIVTTVMSVIRAVITGNWSAIGGIIRNGMNQIRSSISNGFNAAKSAAISAFNALRSGVASALNGVRSAVSSAVSSIRGVFAGAGGWLIAAGRNIIGGLIAGIRSMIGSIGSALGGIGSFIASHKGPPSYDKVMLRPHGRMIMGGLIRGLNDQMNPLGQTLQAVTNRISGIAPRTGGLALGGGSSAGGGVNVTFHNYYPVAEPSSTRATRQMQELAVLGVFHG